MYKDTLAKGDPRTQFSIANGLNSMYKVLGKHCEKKYLKKTERDLCITFSIGWLWQRLEYIELGIKTQKPSYYVTTSIPCFTKKNFSTIKP